MSFFVELWESIFTPGTSPALIQATHGSFVLLILLLALLIYVTGSIHFVNLLVIAVLLYGSVIWFIGELKAAKLKDNAEVAKEKAELAEKGGSEAKSIGASASASGATTSTGTASGSLPATPVKKRKV